jgi:D-amino-acid dehydrogenase
MRVIVLGAGLAGVTSAWYLAEAGHDVTVIERRQGAGLETSFANGGQISVSHPEPWANPGAPAQVLRWLGREDAPLLFRWRADPLQWSWTLRFLGQCLPGPTRRNTAAIAALGVFSRATLRALRDATGIEYDCLACGIVHLFFDKRSLAQGQTKAQALRRYGMQIEVLDRAGCIALEPALAACADTLAGGLYAPEDESGDAYKFTVALADLCAQRGVAFRYGSTVDGIEASAERIVAVRVRGIACEDALEADAYVVAMGSHAPQLVRPLGERLPIYPVKGYSVTIPLASDAPAPNVSVTDESHRIVCSRLGNRLRVAGTAELAGYDTSLTAARCEAIVRRARELFPQLDAAGPVEYWAGLRPATPSNVPIIGRGRLRNLFYNTGHGTLGWTLACGSARALAEILAGRSPEIVFPFAGL